MINAIKNDIVRTVQQILQSLQLTSEAMRSAHKLIFEVIVPIIIRNVHNKRPISIGSMQDCATGDGTFLENVHEAHQTPS